MLFGKREAKQDPTSSRRAKHEEEVERSPRMQAFAARLRALADALEAGRSYALEVSGKTYDVPPNARYSIEFERKGEECEIEIELKWKRDGRS